MAGTWRDSLAPIETWSSALALVGIEYTDAGIARLVRSLTIAAAVYCTIMKPDSVPSSLPIRNAGRPSLVAGSTSLLRRRLAIAASTGIAALPYLTPSRSDVTTSELKYQMHYCHSVFCW